MPLDYGGGAGTVGRAWLPYTNSELRPIPARAVALLGAATTTAVEAKDVLFVGHTQCTEATFDTAGRLNIAAATEALNSDGLHLGKLLVAADGALIAVDACPRINDAESVRDILDSVMEVLSDAAVRW